MPPSGPKAQAQQAHAQAPVSSTIESKPPTVPMTDEERWDMEFDQIPATVSDYRVKINNRVSERS